MLTPAQMLEPLSRLRTSQVVVATASSVRPWGLLSRHDLDFAFVDSAMGYGADLALGIALARPERKVICLNGDGGMLMTLGSLATAVGAAATNLILFLCDNGEFEMTGHQPVAGARRIDHAAFAEAAGFRHVFRFDDPRRYAEALPDVLSKIGPTFVHLVIEPGSERPLTRGPHAPVPYMRSSLGDSARLLRKNLTESRRGPPVL